MRLVLATGNPGKAVEIRDLLAGVPNLELLDRPPGLADPDEDGATLLDNALIKARAVVAHTGEAAVADDTGLEVAALGGAPGHLTARYAGPSATADDNIDRLLRELDDASDRWASWRTIAVVVRPDGAEIVAEGTCEGVIAPERRGRDGFGYDPVFIPEGGGGSTFAELSRAEKNALSHRGRAFRALAVKLAAS